MFAILTSLMFLLLRNTATLVYKCMSVIVYHMVNRTTYVLLTHSTSSLECHKPLHTHRFIRYVFHYKCLCELVKVHVASEIPISASSIICLSD